MGLVNMVLQTKSCFFCCWSESCSVTACYLKILPRRCQWGFVAPQIVIGFHVIGKTHLSVAKKGIPETPVKRLGFFTLSEPSVSRGRGSQDKEHVMCVIATGIGFS